MDEELEVDRTHDLHQFLEYYRRCWTCGACECHNGPELEARCPGKFDGGDHAV